ncbi:MAG: ABC transporter ATP-binding protein [Rickettsiales bacterium]
MTHDVPAIEAIGLKKTYRATKKSGPKTALHGIDLRVPKGSFFALLGPNGAGKSTFINILAGLVNPTEGAAKVCGYDVTTHYKQARYRLGVVPQELLLDPFFPVYEALENTAGFYGVPKKKRRTREIIDAVGLADVMYTPARRLSGGMRRRLLVAKALVHSPEVLILDEPTAGVDVDLRNRLWDYVRELHRSGVTVILTTHYLEEAEKLCDRAAIINRGSIVANDSVRSIMETITVKRVSVRTEEPLAAVPESLKPYRAELLPDGSMRLEYDKNEVNFGQILTLLAESNVKLRDVSTVEPDLEEAFLRLTGERSKK